jgi:hypothetical protein
MAAVPTVTQMETGRAAEAGQEADQKTQQHHTVVSATNGCRWKYLWCNSLAVFPLSADSVLTL